MRALDVKALVHWVIMAKTAIINAIAKTIHHVIQ